MNSGAEKEPPFRERDKKLLDELENAILSYEAEKAKHSVRDIIEKGIDPISVMNYTIANIARIIGDKFEKGEIFLPHLVFVGDILSEVSEILESNLSSEESKEFSGKTIVIGTVEGDIHSIGKNIVAMMLKANGFKAFDLGVDVKSDKFIEQAKEKNSQIIAMSSLLTTTMPYQKEVVEELKRLGCRNLFKVVVGGGPITKEWADEIGADEYGEDAIDAIDICKKLVKNS